MAVARTAAPLLPQFSSQECFNLVYGYAKLRFEPCALLAALVPEVVSRAFDFTPQVPYLLVSYAYIHMLIPKKLESVVLFRTVLLLVKLSSFYCKAS